MAVAANHLREIGGGQVAVVDGRVAGEVACPIGGLLSDAPMEEVARAFTALNEAAMAMGATIPSPFMTMSFLALSVIPELKITDRGLVDTVAFELVPLEV
jgi:adenine deaminase